MTCRLRSNSNNFSSSISNKGPQKTVKLGFAQWSLSLLKVDAAVGTLSTFLGPTRKAIT